MNKKNFFWKYWKVWLNIVTILSLLFVIYLTRNDILSTIENLKKVNAYFLLLLLPIEFLNYHAQTKLYQSLFKIVGNNFNYRSLFRVSLELNFVNHVFPSGGVSGISFFGLRLRNGDQLTGGKATLIQIMKLGLTLVSFEVLIIIGVFLLAVAGHVSNIAIFVASTISTMLLFLSVLFIYIVGSKKRINNFFLAITKATNWFLALFRNSRKDTIDIQKARKAFNDFHESYKEIRRNLDKVRAAFLYALLANLTEVLAIFVVYLAFDKVVNLGAIILAYGVANFAGLVSVLPGGIGIYEALMTVILATVGVSPRISIPVTIMYRILNTLIQIPAGYFLYQKTINRRKASANEFGKSS